ncbi:1-phosphatidylinositol phosphodiesterase [Gracilariopsis chorda]|uniref:1-phosphatidylinositol phosphodiesterase n=1 Tax=Gracilariopsis chorda TaxID=448386 RepID=A0A2V3ILP2_9FLOR|nr:1-phosphatidylinositol phosphodiesterase [Gracilariopsis chorda]|eukprot:PXF42967.1 1-phosphatidylinositol phosphodiesterase [Gracilariopsis chorda]
MAPDSSTDENVGLVSSSIRRPRSRISRVLLSILVLAMLACVVVIPLRRQSDSLSHYVVSPSPVGALIESRLTVLDEDSKSEGTISSSSSPASWLTSAVEDWMIDLPSSKSIAHVSIPGTHDSGARFGGVGCETQSWTIEKQLKAGIRFFDIRCRIAGTVFSIHHGPCFQEMFFGDVLIDVQDFLYAHPNEFVIMNIQEEHKPMSGSSSFSSIWSTYRSRFNSLFVDSRSSLPTVGQVRGKVLLISTLSLGKGIKWDSALTETQNIYKVYALLNDNPFGSSTASIGQKKTLVRSYIDKAASSSKLVLNFLSGAEGMIPKDVARSTNQNAYEHIGAYNGAKRVGVIIMDFPGEKLVYRVIKTNFEATEYCEPRTWRTQSGKTWAEFRMPRAVVGTSISIKGGAYYKYKFPKCHRATWTDLRFVCSSSSRTWEVASGSWDADAWCHNSNTNQDYLAVGVL